MRTAVKHGDTRARRAATTADENDGEAEATTAQSRRTQREQQAHEQYTRPRRAAARTRAKRGMAITDESDDDADATADDGAADEGSKSSERHATQSGGTHAGESCNGGVRAARIPEPVGGRGTISLLITRRTRRGSRRAVAVY